MINAKKLCKDYEQERIGLCDIQAKIDEYNSSHVTQWKLFVFSKDQCRPGVMYEIEICIQGHIAYCPCGDCNTLVKMDMQYKHDMEIQG